MEACPTEALCFDGREMDSEQIVEILSEDMPFYEESGGGITLSGGDPLFQPEFSLEILKACKDKKIHTAIETCMYARQDIIEKFLDFTDLFIVDLKIFDSYKHKMYTGVENELIKSNFRFIASQKTDILVRIPLIPGITATDENLRKTARFVRDTNPEIPIELMNYNILAENKYRLMKKENNLIKGMKPFLEARLEEFYRIIEGEGARILKDTKIGN